MTMDELKKELRDRRIRESAVSFGHDSVGSPEHYCIQKEGVVWEVFYYERGNKNNLRVFTDENQACIYLSSILKKDKTVWV